MRTTKTIQKEVEVTDDIICNKCGETCDSSRREGGPEGHHTDGGFQGLLGVRVDGGYGSNHLGDCVRYEFDTCEKCLMEWFKTFKINPHNLAISGNDTVKKND